MAASACMGGNLGVRATREITFGRVTGDDLKKLGIGVHALGLRGVVELPASDASREQKVFERERVSNLASKTSLVERNVKEGKAASPLEGRAHQAAHRTLSSGKAEKAQKHERRRRASSSSDETAPPKKTLHRSHTSSTSSLSGIVEEIDAFETASRNHAQRRPAADGDSWFDYLKDLLIGIAIGGLSEDAVITFKVAFSECSLWEIKDLMQMLLEHKDSPALKDTIQELIKNIGNNVIERQDLNTYHPADLFMMLHLVFKAHCLLDGSDREKIQTFVQAVFKEIATRFDLKQQEETDQIDSKQTEKVDAAFAMLLVELYPGAGYFDKLLGEDKSFAACIYNWFPSDVASLKLKPEHLVVALKAFSNAAKSVKRESIIQALVLEIYLNRNHFNEDQLDVLCKELSKVENPQNREYIQQITSQNGHARLKRK